MHIKAMTGPRGLFKPHMGKYKRLKIEKKGRPKAGGGPEIFRRREKKRSTPPEKGKGVIHAGGGEKFTHRGGLKRGTRKCPPAFGTL